MRSAAAIFGCFCTIISCYAIGTLLFDFLRLSAFLRRQERYPLAFLLGASALHLWMFLLLALQLVYWPLILLPLTRIVVWAWQSRTELQPFPALNRLLGLVAGIPAAAFFAVYLVHAWAPEHSSDGSEYHLGILARELRHHGFERITTSFYAMLGQGVELVFAPAFLIGGHSSAALTHLAFGVALGLAIFNFGRRMEKPWVGAAAALLTFLSPVFGLNASEAYVDAGAAAIVFAAFYWLEIWDKERDPRLLIPAGLMAGYAIAAKYTAFPIAIYAIGFVLLRSRKLKPVLMTAAFATLMGGPWIARNWIVYQNPIGPMGTAIFRNPYTHVIFEEQSREYFARMDIENLWTLPWEVTVHGKKTASLIGPVFLLLPIGLLALRSRKGRHLWMATAFVTMTYFANVGTRFLIPSLPFFSLSIALAIGELPLLLGGLMLLHALLSWPPNILWYSHRDAGRITGMPIREALRLTGEEEYLNRVLPGYPVARMIDKHVPPGETVFSKDGVAWAYMERELRHWFASASNETLNDSFDMGANAAMQPTRILVFRFSARSGRRVRFEQLASANRYNLWSIHEIQILHNGTEIPQQPAWRFEASPVPWEAKLAFDRDSFTRWRTWETAKPGMYIEVDFGRDETIDEIRIETSVDSDSARIQPQIESGSGGWEQLSVQLEARDVPPFPDARRRATAAMSNLGLHYIVLYNNSARANEVTPDPSAWGLQEIARTSIARLYKILP